MSHYSTSLPELLQDRDQFHRSIHGHVLVIFDAIRSLGLEHGRLVAGGQTGHSFESEETIWRGLADFDAEVLAQGLHEFIGAAQGTGQIGADLHAILAVFFIVIQRVKADNARDIRLGDVNDLGNILHRGFGEIAFFTLRQVQQRHDRRAFVLRRIFRKNSVLLRSDIFLPGSSVNISEHNVNGSKDGNQVGHQMSLDDLGQHGQIVEGRRAPVDAVRLGSAIAFEENTQFAAR